MTVRVDGHGGPAAGGGPRDPMDAATRRRLVEARLATARALLQAAGGSAWWTTSRANLAWLTAGGQHHVVHADANGVAGILLTPDTAWLVTTTIERDRLADEEVGGLGLAIETVPWFDPDGPAGAIPRLLHRGAAVDDVAMAAAGLVDARSRLDPVDVERLAVLGEVARRAVVEALAAAEPGTTEAALAAELVGRLVGVRAPVVLVAADDRIARYRHPLPTDRPIRGRVMLVLVAEAWGLHVALTRFRTFEPESADLERRWAAVREVQAAMLAASRPGATLGAVLAAAQGAYAAAGFPDEWRDHHQGGTIAYQGRERVATPDHPTVLTAPVALAWNPSIAGVKVEDTVVLEPDGRQRSVTGDPDP